MSLEVVEVSGEVYIYVCLFALEDIMPFIHIVLPLYTLYVCVIRVVQTVTILVDNGGNETDTDMDI